MRLFWLRQPKESQHRRQPALREAVSESDTFRRGRTLTGSVSSLIRSSNESRADLKSSRVHAHALAKHRRRLYGVFTGSLAIAITLFFLVSQFTADPIVRASPDTSLKLDGTYAESINDYLSDHISQRWRFATDVKALQSHLQQSTPEVGTVQVRGAVGFGESLFEVTFREPIASWEVGGTKLYVDAEGVTFSKNYFSSPSLQISDQSGLSTPSGQTVMSNRFMSYVGQVIGLSEQQGYTVTNIVIPEGMTRQINVYLQDVPYPFKFSSDRPAGEGVEDMVRAYTWMSTRGIEPEYVDVRVSGRAFYR